MTKKIRVLFLVALIVGILSGTASAFEGNTVGIYLQENNNERQFITSYASTVEELLIEQGLVLDMNDTIEPSLDTLLETTMKVHITRGVTVNVTIDGEIFKNRPVQSERMMVNEFVTQYSAQTGIDYMFDMSLWSVQLEDGMYLNLTTRKTEEFTSLSSIPFETVYVEDSNMYEGRSTVITDGENGELTTVTKVDFIGGEEVAREIISEAVTKEAVDEVIMIGTARLLETPDAESAEIIKEAIQNAHLREQVKLEAERAEAARLEAERIEAERIAAEKEAKRKEAERVENERLARVKAAENKLAQIGLGNIAVKKVLTMTSTAYTADYESTGKNPGDYGFGITRSGMKARVGVVAVDPKVIPLGTKLFIEGYGEAIAGDTGSAIIGNKIDLYFNTNWECKQYGRQSIQVYILE